MKKISTLFLFILFISTCSPIPEKKLYSESFKNKKTWTIFVYMAANSNLGDVNGTDFTALNLKQMERVDLKDEIKVIVIRERLNYGTDIYKIQYDPSNSSSMISPKLSWPAKGISPTLHPYVNLIQTTLLADFVHDFSLLYPSDYYGVILWAHGDGYKSTTKGIDDNNGTMINSNIAQALAFKNISALGFDACVQGSMETLWAIKKSSDVGFVIASPDNIPASSWNYYYFLSYFFDSYRRPVDFGVQAVEAYKRSYYNRPASSLAAYDLTNLDVNALETTPGTLKHFIAWANTNKVTEKPKIQASITYGSFNDFVDYSNRSTYPYKDSILSNLNSLIKIGWKQEYGYKKVLGISNNDPINDYPVNYPVSYNGVPFFIDTKWILIFH